MWLTLLALRNRIGILMLSLAMVVLGATSLNRLPRDLFPNIQVPAAFVTVSGGNLDERGLYDLAFNTIAPQVEQLPNVAAATVEGGKVRQININLDPAMLQGRGLSILDVVKAVKASNLILPSGDLKAGNLDYNVFTNNQFKTVEPINDVIVKATPEGTPVRVKDLGTVTDSSDIQTNIVRTDGQRSVYLRVNKQPIANTVEVVDALRRALPKMIGVPPGVKLGVSFDQSVYIRQSIKNLIDQAIEGSVLAAAVILIFLRNVTSTLIIAVAIPLSVLVTFITLYFTGQTLNIMTLGGLALGVGRLVDDSIVELENIQRHLNTGQNRWEALLEAAREVAMPIFASTVTTVVVFLPIFFVVGIAKLLFVPLVFTIAIALFTSFFVSRTVTPVLCLKLLKPEQEARRHLPAWWVRVLAWSQATYDASDARYQEMLAWVMGHRKSLIISVVAISFETVLLITTIGMEFIQLEGGGKV